MLLDVDTGRSVDLIPYRTQFDTLRKRLSVAEFEAMLDRINELIDASGLARPTDILDYHSSVTDVALTAARNGVRSVVLTHLVPAPAPGTEQQWIDQARAHFDGEVVLAADLLTLDVAA